MTFVTADEIQEYLMLKNLATEFIEHDSLQRLLSEQTKKLGTRTGAEKLRYQNILRDTGLHQIVFSCFLNFLSFFLSYILSIRS